jgi:transcriptional regulator with XRE-family HTH domain
MLECVPPTPAANHVVALNIRRLLARFGWRYDDLIAASGLDERTIRRLMQGKTEPRPGTLHKLAEAFAVDTNELFLDTPELFAASFDRATNPQIDQAVEEQPELFAGWGEMEFAELASRFGVGGELTVDGALAMADTMNRRRETLQRTKLLLETSDGELLAQFVDMLWHRSSQPSAAGNHPVGE